MVGLAKLREQPHQRAAGGILNLVGQLDAVGLLPATEENLGAADDVAEQFLDAVLGHGQMGLDGLAGSMASAPPVMPWASSVSCAAIQEAMACFSSSWWRRGR
jgi:hypothetical protein